MKPYQRLLLILCLCCGVAWLSLPAMTLVDASGPPVPTRVDNDANTRKGYEHFYNLDYDGSLSRFEAIQHANPQSPIATGYVLMVLIFRELYHQDLLDTTYYAHDSFLTSKRSVPVPQATRDRIEQLTSSAISLSDQQIHDNPNNANAYFARDRKSVV